MDCPSEKYIYSAERTLRLLLGIEKSKFSCILYESERKISLKKKGMGMKKDILNNRYYLYATEFFAGMAVMAVELGASRLLAPLFQFFPDRVDDYYRDDHDRHGFREYLRRQER